MYLIFDYNEPNYKKLLVLAIKLLQQATKPITLRKALIAEIYKDKAFATEEEIKLMYALESKKNREFLISQNFSYEALKLELPTTFLKELPTKAKIIIDARKLSQGGGLGKFVCDHSARISNAFRVSKLYPTLDLTGFIHVPEKPNLVQFAEVITLLLKSTIEKYQALKSIRIMLTGFTQFNRVKDNITGEFLFGDGISIDKNSFAFKEPTNLAYQRLDMIISKVYKKVLKSEFLFMDKIKVGKKYFFEDKELEIILVRLPVDTEILKKENYLLPQDLNYENFLQAIENNTFGDRVQHILAYAIQKTKPKAIFSFGVHAFLPSDIYELETEIWGLSTKYTKKIRPLYYNNLGKGKNYQLLELFK